MSDHDDFDHRNVMVVANVIGIAVFVLGFLGLVLNLQ